MNECCRTIIYPRKDKWPYRGSNKRPHFLKYRFPCNLASLPTLTLFTPSLPPPFSHSLVHSLARSPTHSLAHSPVDQTLTRSHSLSYSFTHQSIRHSLTQSLTHSLARSPTHSLTHSLTYSITHLHGHSLTHSLAHSLNHSLTLLVLLKSVNRHQLNYHRVQDLFSSICRVLSLAQIKQPKSGNTGFIHLHAAVNHMFSTNYRSIKPVFFIN